MKKISPMAEMRMVDTIRAARESSGRGTNPSEAVAKLAMEQNMSTEQAARICEAFNKLASIDHLSSDQGDRAANFPLADSSAVRKIMRDSLKVANEPFKFRRTINDDLPLPKMTDKQAMEMIYKPTEEEQKMLDTATDRMQYLADWERTQSGVKAMKVASEEARLGELMFGEAFIKFGNKVASMDDRAVDNMARYAVYNYGKDGVNFLTALENLTGREIDKSNRPCMKTGSDAENEVDRLMFMADNAKALKVAADLVIDGNKVPFGYSMSIYDPNLNPAQVNQASSDLTAKRKALQNINANYAYQVNEDLAEKLDRPDLTGAGSEAVKQWNNRLNTVGKLKDTTFNESQRDTVEDTKKIQNATNKTKAEFEKNELGTVQGAQHIRNQMGLTQAQHDQSVQGTRNDTDTVRTRTDNAKAKFEEQELPDVQSIQHLRNQMGLTQAQHEQATQATRNSTDAIRVSLDNARAVFDQQQQPGKLTTEANKNQVEAAKARDALEEQQALDDARAHGRLESVGDEAERAARTRELESRQKYEHAQAVQNYEQAMQRSGNGEEQRMLRQYERAEADRAWMEEERLRKSRVDNFNRLKEQGDRTSKALQEMANNTLANTKSVLGGAVGIMQKADAIRQALTPEQRSGNAAARPLSNAATKYLENLRLHDVFAKTYLSDPYLHQYSPSEVAEAFNIVYEVAPELVRHGSNPHIIGALIRKYLANTNQLDPLEIRDLTSTEKDRVDTMLKQEQLEAIKRGK